MGSIASGRDLEKVRSLTRCPDQSDDMHKYLIISQQVKMDDRTFGLN